MFRSRSKTLAVREEREGLTVGYYPESKPWLMVCSLRAMQGLPFDEGLLRRWGYRRWSHSSASPMGYYARPLPIWVLVWFLEGVRLGYWYLIKLLFDLGLVHIRDEAGYFRWRDVRPGRGP